jgi:hypothetical protein
MTAIPTTGRRHATASGVLLLTALLVMSVPARAFECPAPDRLMRPGVLKESSSQIAELTSILASGDASNHVPVIVADLRRRYPGVENAEVANYLMTAYCPATARLSGLSDAEKQTRIDRFASQIREMIYSQADVAPPDGR